MGLKTDVGCKLNKLSFLFCFFLLFTQSVIFPKTFLFAQDWIVTDNQVIKDTTIILNRNLIVKDGGSLTLNSATIQIDCQYEGQYKILVLKSGSFFILNNSEIKALNSDYHFSFACYGQEFIMKNSKLRNVGWGPLQELGWDTGSGNRGPYIASPSTVIDSSEISDNHVGLILASDSAAVRNCTISSCTINGIFLRDTKHALIKNNVISLSAIQQDLFAPSLIDLSGGYGNQILDNQLNSPPIGTDCIGIRLLNSHNNLIDGNDICTPLICIIMMWVCDENTISNNIIKAAEGAVIVMGWNNKVENNTITPYQEWTGDPIFLIYAYNTQIINNNIIDMHFRESSGIMLRHSSNNLIMGNEITTQSRENFQDNARGIFLTGSSSHNVISSNSINGCTRGILVCYASNDNKIYNNELSNIYFQGFLFDNADSNLIYSNNSLTSAGRPSFDDGDNVWNYSGAEPIFTNTIKPSFDNIYDEQISGNKVIENQTINLRNVDILEGGSLTLRNVTLITGVDPSSISSLIARSNASLEIDNCKILLHEYGSGFDLYAEPNSSLILKGSEIRGAGRDWWYKGIFFVNDNVEIENCIFYEATIIFRGCNGVRFSGNKVYNTYTSILFFNEPSNITITDNIIDGSMRHAFDGQGSNMTIKNNQISNIWGIGVNLSGLRDALIEDNTIENIYEPYPGIEAAWEGGKVNSNTILNSYIGIYYQSDTEIINNQISQCNIGFLTKAGFQSLSDNNISDCDVGLYLDGTDNTINEFVIADCDTGVYVSENAENNVIYGNDFIENKIQVNNNFPPDIKWSHNGRGNFWSDYYGYDQDGNGIGDTPYQIQNGIYDNFPLMSPGNINIKSIYINVNSVNVIPTSFSAGDTNIVIAKLSVQIAQEDSGNTANLLGIKMDRDGTGLDSDLSNIKIWKDVNNDESFNADLDSLIGQGVVNEGKANLTFYNEESITLVPNHFFISIDISSTISSIGNTVGFSCQDSSYFLTKFPAKVKNTNFPMVFNEQTLPVEQKNLVPLTFSIEQNYPNPFNSGTLIYYQIPKPSNVLIQIFNPNGQLIRTLVNKQMDAAVHSVYWDGKDDTGFSVASGIYFYKVTTVDFSKVKKMILIQ